MTLVSKLLALFHPPSESPKLPEPLYPEATTELAVLSSLLSDPALSETLGTFGLHQQALASRLSTQSISNRQQSEDSLKRVRGGVLSAAAGGLGVLGAKRQPQEDLLGFLVTMGSDEIRNVLHNIGFAPGPLVFWLAHRGVESDLRGRWPASTQGRARVAVVNDPYSPMEAVLPCLSAAFGLSEEKAVQLMLRIHHEGAVHLDVPTAVPVEQFCEDCNLRWRAIPLPLYVHPVAV